MTNGLRVLPELVDGVGRVPNLGQHDDVRVPVAGLADEAFRILEVRGLVASNQHLHDGDAQRFGCCGLRTRWGSLGGEAAGEQRRRRERYSREQTVEAMHGCLFDDF